MINNFIDKYFSGGSAMGLSFFWTASKFEKDFEEERQELLNKSVAIGSILGAVLVPLFGILDIVFKAHQLQTFFIIRLIVTAGCIMIFWLTKKQIGQKYPYQLGAILTLIVAGSIALMCRIDQGPVDRYYAGINLPLLGFGMLLPLTLVEGIIILSTGWLVYFIPNLLILAPAQVGIFTSNNFFMISTIIIALASSQFHLHQRRLSWMASKRLKLAHKRIKEHANDLEKEVEERSRQLIQSERLAVVGQLAGGIAHDFNNILTAILGACQLAMDSLPKTHPVSEDLDSIFKVGNRAAELVKQLLAFSRKQILQPRIVCLNDIIKDVRKMLDHLIGENVELEVDLEPNLGKVKVDPVQVEQIIFNLAVNARDAMKNGGKLTIQTSIADLDEVYCRMGKLSLKPGRYIRLTVIDNGEGMNKEIKGKIFEPFFTTKSKERGTGLGLSSVYGIVKQSRGDIIVYSEVGKGTVFKIYLPLITRKEMKEERKRKMSIIPEGKETILLVEDEEQVRKLTARILERQGYRVLQAEEGAVALEMVKRHEGHIDLLLTDIVMPNMNGPVLADQIRQIESGVKVLYISGHIDSTIMQYGLEKENTSFLQKPYTMESLHMKVRNVIGN